MKVKRLEAERDNVIGLVPVYTDTGNATEIWLKTGEVWVDNRTIKTTRTVLARSYAIDLKAQRLKVEEMVNRKGPLPFYIGNRVFMQLKFRKPATANDMVYGFIDISQVKSLESLDQGRRCEAILKSGRSLKVLSSYSTAIKSWQTGQKLLELINIENRVDEDDGQIVKSVVLFIDNFKEINSRLERIEDRIAESGVRWGVDGESAGSEK